MIRFLIVVWTMSCAVACGDDQSATDTGNGGAEREGPAGCYVSGLFRCDCAIEEAECTEATGGQWVESGCASCP